MYPTPLVAIGWVSMWIDPFDPSFLIGDPMHQAPILCGPTWGMIRQARLAMMPETAAGVVIAPQINWGEDFDVNKIRGWPLLWGPGQRGFLLYSTGR